MLFRIPQPPATASSVHETQTNKTKHEKKKKQPKNDKLQSWSTKGMLVYCERLELVEDKYMFITEFAYCCFKNKTRQMYVNCHVCELDTNDSTGTSLSIYTCSGEIWLLTISSSFYILLFSKSCWTLALWLYVTENVICNITVGPAYKKLAYSESPL